nr:oligosaccharide flippase family protein [Halovulum dunhuangense]
MLLVLVLLTRILGPVGFGLYNMLTVAATIAFGVLFAWLRIGIIRFHAASDFGGRAFGIALGAGLVVIFALVAVMAAAALWLEGAPRALLLAGAAYCLAHAGHEVAIAGLRVRREGPAFAAVLLARPLLGALLVMALVLAGGGAVAAVLGMALGAGLAALWPLGRLVRALGRPALPTRAQLRAMLSFGVPLGIVASGSMIFVLISQLVLSRMVGLAEVGAFAAAQTIALRAIAMPMMTLAMSADATIFELYEREGGPATRTALERYVSVLLLVSVPVTAVIALSGDTLARLLFAGGFEAEVARHMPPLALAAFLTGLQGAYFGFSFTIGRRSGLQLKMMAGLAALHGLVSLVLVAALGGIGASVGALVTGGAGLAVFVVMGARVHRMSLPGGEFRKMALAVLAAAPFLLGADRVAGPWLAFGLIGCGLLVFALALLVQAHDGILLAGRRLRARMGV